MKEKTTFQLFKYVPLVFLALMFACASPPDYPIEPEIEYVSLSKDTLRRGSIFDDTTYITIAFTDGDGDIGRNDSIQNLFLRDLRDSNMLNYQAPFVPELGASNGIKGEITVQVYTSCCIFPDTFYNGCTEIFPSMPYDKVIYEIYMLDRAGHQSNVVQTQPIYIRCFE